MAGPNVNRPVNQAERNASINEKLQLYGIITGFQNGKVPSNEQIDVALNSFIKSKAIANPSQKLSPEGRDLVKDVRDVVEQAKLLLLSKNDGNLLQDFIWQTQKVTGGNASVPNAPIDKETAQAHGNDALQGLRTLGTLIITNGQFRKLLKDASIILRDIAGDAAQNAANRINPDESDLAQVDEPAEDNTWHDTPDFSRDNLKSQFKNATGRNTDQAPVDRSDVNRSAQVARQEGPLAGAQHLANSSDIPDEKIQEGKDAVRNKKEEYKGQAKDYLGKKMPQERRDQTIWRLKKMVVEIQGHSDYQQAIDTLLNLAETYTGHAQTLGRDSHGQVKEAHGDDALTRAETDLRTLLERFANGTSFDSLMEAINQIYTDANRDPELKQWFKDTDTFIRRCLKEQGYILQDSSTQHWNQLQDHGRYLLRDRYRDHTDRIYNEFRFIGEQFDEDAQNTRFGESVAKLFKDLGTDEQGKSTFKPHLFKDVTEVILPAVLEHVSYVPIPRIEYQDPAFDFVVENLILESDNLTPNMLRINTNHDFTWGRKGAAKTSKKNDVEINVSGVQMDLRDVAFYIKRKQGFPSITDTGLADIFLGGSGFSFKIRMATADEKDRQNFFKISKVDIDIKNFNIKLKKSSHKLLFALAKPLMLKAIRPALQKALEKAIQQKFHEADQLLYRVKLEADRAMEEAKKNPENAPNLYQNYVNAFRKQITKGQQKAEQLKQQAAQRNVNVTYTHDNLLFPGIKLGGTISTKTTEYKELAHKGEKWESPIFSIGSAGKSTDIPKPVKITRKKAPSYLSRNKAATGAGVGAAGAGAGAGAYGASPYGYSSNQYAGQQNTHTQGTQLPNAQYLDSYPSATAHSQTYTNGYSGTKTTGTGNTLPGGVIPLIDEGKIVDSQTGQAGKTLNTAAAPALTSL